LGDWDIDEENELKLKGIGRKGLEGKRVGREGGEVM
jgi:hypothetical protein